MPKIQHLRPIRVTSRAPQPAKLAEAAAARAASLEHLAPGAIVQRAMAARHSLRPAELMAMQQTLGNRATGAMLGRQPIQAKLIVNAPGDAYEREADRMADAAMRMPAAPRQETPGVEYKDQVRPVAAQGQLGSGGIAAPPDVEAAIDGARGGGQPLPGRLRSRLEEAFGADFGNVRIHADAQSDLLNRSLQAQAFTTGNDLFFRHGAYAPRSRHGQQLVAHELAHVVQQASGLDSAFGQGSAAPRKAEPAAIQRYVIGQAVFTTSAVNLVGQDRQADNSFRDPADPTHARIIWSGADPSVANSLKISEDGKMAIENVTGNRQAKVFFAVPSIVQKSNDVLIKKGSKYLLQPMPSGHYIAVADQKGNNHLLNAIEAVLNPDAEKKSTTKRIAGRLAGQQQGLNVEVEQTCIAVAEAIMNKKYNEGGAYMSANKLAKLGLVGPTQAGQWAAAVADVMANPNNRTPLLASQILDEDTIVRAYGIFINANPVAAAHMAQTLGVNEFASPKVGQSFVSESVGVPAGGGVINWLLDPTGNTSTSLLTLDPNVRGGKRRTGWGNHMGAVVARSGGNTITLENYARTGEDPTLIENDKSFYFAMYGPETLPAQTWHHAWSRGNTPIANAVTGAVG